MLSLNKITTSALIAAAAFSQAYALPSHLITREDGPSPTRDCLSIHKPGFTSSDETIADECYKATIEYIRAPTQGPIKNVAGLFALVPICGLGALEIPVTAATCAATSAMSLFGKALDHHAKAPSIKLDNTPAQSHKKRLPLECFGGSCALAKRIVIDCPGAASPVCVTDTNVTVKDEWFKPFVGADGKITGQSIVDFLKKNAGASGSSATQEVVAAWEKAIFGVFPATEEVSKDKLVDVLNTQLGSN